MVLALGGCSSVISSATARMASSLGDAIVNQNDPETVREAAPAYLVLLDGLIRDDPDNPDVLMAGADLYSSYAALFVEDSERAKRLSAKARDYGFSALCRQHEPLCGTWTAPYPEFETAVETLQREDVPAAFSAAGAWTTWIQTRRGDWSAVADKARVDALLRRVVELEPEYRSGTPYIYLGVLETLLPAALGGRPEEGRQHFERAIEISDGRNLMAKVLMASDYARLVFDRELHDRLLREVLAAEPEEPGLTLSNALAQDLAANLLDSSEEYFGD